MTTRVYDLQGYAVVVSNIAFITRVFEADADEGYQFNVRFIGDMRLSPKYATRSEADLSRQLLIQAIEKTQVQG